MPPVAIYFYDVVKALHIAAFLVAFGLVFAYPLIVTTLQRQAAGALEGFHRASIATILYILTPGAVLGLATGVYLASDRDLWDRSWVTVPMVVLFAVLGIAHGFLLPRERQAAERAAGGGADYAATVRQLGMGAAFAGALVLVAVFFMTAKPGGY